MVVREFNYLIIPKEFNATVPRDFWSDKFLYDALLPVIIISILTSAIILTGIGILRMVIKILKLIFCQLGNSESELFPILIRKILNLKRFVVDSMIVWKTSVHFASLCWRAAKALLP